MLVEGGFPAADHRDSTLRLSNTCCLCHSFQNSWENEQNSCFTVSLWVVLYKMQFDMILIFQHTKWSFIASCNSIATAITSMGSIFFSFSLQLKGSVLSALPSTFSPELIFPFFCNQLTDSQGIQEGVTHFFLSLTWAQLKIQLFLLSGIFSHSLMLTCHAVKSLNH